MCVDHDGLFFYVADALSFTRQSMMKQDPKVTNLNGEAVAAMSYATVSTPRVCCWQHGVHGYHSSLTSLPGASLIHCLAVIVIVTVGGIPQILCQVCISNKQRP